MEIKSNKTFSVLRFIQEIGYRTSLVVTLGMFLYVLFWAFTEFGGMPFLGEALSLWQKILFMLLGLTIYAGLLYVIWRGISRWEDHKIRIGMAVLAILWAAVQVAFLLTMKIRLRYDSLKVLDEAISVCKSGSVSPDHFDGYFARYTNNYPILFVTVLLLKMGRATGLIADNFYGADTLLGVVNILAIDMAAFVIIRLLRRMFGEKCAFLVMLCIILNPLFVIWSPFYYTNTLSMPFVALILLLFYDLRDKEKVSVRKMAFRYFLLGICAVCGFRIRATVLLTIMACLMYVLLGGKRAENDSSISGNIRYLLLSCTCLLAGALLAGGLYHAAKQRFVKFDYKDSAFPAVHWINMGAGGTGEYNILDEQNTINCITQREKKEMNWQSYQTRLKQMGMSGYARLMLQKLRLTFSDAGAGYRSELGVSDLYHDQNLYLVGGKSDLIAFLIQVSYVLSLISLSVCTCMLLVQKPRADQNRFTAVILWNIVGAFCFHMLWEAGTIYSLSFAMLFPAGMGCAVGCLKVRAKQNGGCFAQRIRPWIKPAGVLQAGVCVCCFVSIYTKVVAVPFITNDAVVNQYIYEWGSTEELTEGETCTQSFYVNRGFNHMSFGVRNRIGEQNDAVYQICLYDPQKKCVGKYEIQASAYGDYDFARIEVEGMEQADHPGTYEIRIEKTGGSAASNLVFLSYRTGNYDAYSYGALLSGEPLSDLCFSAYETKEEPYMERGRFFCVFAVILAVTAAIQICLRYWLLKDPSQ